MLLEINLTPPRGTPRLVRLLEPELTGIERQRESGKAATAAKIKMAAELLVKARAQIIQFVRENPGYNGNQIYTSLGIPANMGKKAIKSLSLDGTIVRPGGAGYVIGRGK